MADDAVAEVRIASLGRRLLAGGIDALIPMGVGVAVARTYLLWGRRSHRHDGEGVEDGPPRIELSTRARRLMAAAELAFALEGRNWRTPGDRLLGIRAADARTHGPVTFRSALVRRVTTEAWDTVAEGLLAPNKATASTAIEDIDRQIRAIQRAHPDDPQAVQEATNGVYMNSGLGPSTSCVWPIIVRTAPSVPVVWSSSKQSIADRIAGIIVVADDRPIVRRNCRGAWPSGRRTRRR